LELPPRVQVVDSSCMSTLAGNDGDGRVHDIVGGALDMVA
jgi:hypothetical protein